jgi:hypothetical protein
MVRACIILHEATSKTEVPYRAPPRGTFAYVPSHVKAADPEGARSRLPLIDVGPTHYRLKENPDGLPSLANSTGLFRERADRI